MSGSRRGSALLRELSRAEAKIETLEEFISERERQLHVAVSRLRSRGDSRRTSRTNIRRRRAGITSDALLRMHSLSCDSFEYADNGELINFHLRFICRSKCVCRCVYATS